MKTPKELITHPELKQEVRGFVVRPLRYADLSQVRELEKESPFEISNFIEGILEDDRKNKKPKQDYAYGCFLKRSLIGFCTIGGADEIEWSDDSEELLGDVFIKEKHRGLGFGTAMMKFILAEHKKGNIYADVMCDELECFYFPLGFIRFRPGMIIFPQKNDGTDVKRRSKWRR